MPRGDAGDVASGAAGGAMTGAAVGSMFGPWGTAIGGVGGGLLGGISGYFGGGSPGGLSPEQQAQYDAYIQSIGGREVNSDFRADQRALVTDLQAQASGRGPSLATAQLNANSDRLSRNVSNIANAARGSYAPLAQFQAQNQSAFGQAQAGQDAAAAQIAEQTAARNQLGLTLHGARGQDIESQLRLMGMNDAAIAQYMQTGAGKAPVVSQGDALLAGGANALSTMAPAIAGQRGAAPVSGGSPAPVNPYTGNGPAGDNTINPFPQSDTINPFVANATGTSSKNMAAGAPQEGAVISQGVGPALAPIVNDFEYRQKVLAARQAGLAAQQRQNTARSRYQIQQSTAPGRSPPAAPTGQPTIGQVPFQAPLNGRRTV